MLVSTNAVFLEEDYMIDQRALSWVVLKEIQEKTIPSPLRTELD